MDTSSLLDLIQTLGLPFVFANVLVEQLGLPLPATPTLALAGAAAAQGTFSPSQLVMVALAACVLADGAWYALGRTHGTAALKAICRMSLTSDETVRHVSLHLKRWGPWVFLFGKFLPGIGILANPLAGAIRVSWGSFLLLTSLGSVLWAALVVGMGAHFHDELRLLLEFLQKFGIATAIVLLLAMASYVVAKHAKRRRFQRMIRMPRITVAELNSLIASGRVPIIIDVRTDAARSADGRSIPGSRAVALGDVHRLSHELPRDREIVVYCSCPNEASAAIAVRVLNYFGFTARPLLGGLDAWSAERHKRETAASGTDRLADSIDRGAVRVS